MEIFMTDIPAARRGAACLGFRLPWANLAGVGAKHALAPNAVLAVGSNNARRAAFQPVTAPPTQSAPMAAELLPAVVSEARTQKHVQKTRIDAGGYGAMGPYPEREQPA